MTTSTADVGRAAAPSGPAHGPDEGRAWRRPTDGWRWEPRHAGYVASVVIDVLLLYAAHNLLAWGVAFVTPAWAEVLWAVDLSLQASIVANALFLVYDAAWFRNLAGVATTGTGLLAGYELYRVFPFELGRWSDLARLGLLAVLVALGIALVVVAVTALVEIAGGRTGREGGAA
jgi:hypothetical protein